MDEFKFYPFIILNIYLSLGGKVLLVFCIKTFFPFLTYIRPYCKTISYSITYRN